MFGRYYFIHSAGTFKKKQLKIKKISGTVAILYFDNLCNEVSIVSL